LADWKAKRREYVLNELMSQLANEPIEKIDAIQAVRSSVRKKLTIVSYFRIISITKTY
jgi:hypothetical protein